jgi:hypothetical protein
VNAFEKAAPFTRQEIDDYAADLRETNAISDIERADGDLITLLRREVRRATDTTSTLGGTFVNNAGGGRTHVGAATALRRDMGL